MTAKGILTILSIFVGAGILQAVLVLIHLYIRKHYHYACPCCNETFKPTTFLNSVGIINVANRWLVCPHCGKKSYMELLKDKDPSAAGDK